MANIPNPFQSVFGGAPATTWGQAYPASAASSMPLTGNDISTLRAILASQTQGMIGGMGPSPAASWSNLAANLSSPGQQTRLLTTPFNSAAGFQNLYTPDYLPATQSTGVATRSVGVANPTGGSSIVPRSASVANPMRPVTPNVPLGNPALPAGNIPRTPVTSLLNNGVGLPTGNLGGVGPNALNPGPTVRVAGPGGGPAASTPPPASGAGSASAGGATGARAGASGAGGATNSASGFQNLYGASGAAAGKGPGFFARGMAGNPVSGIANSNFVTSRAPSWATNPLAASGWKGTALRGATGLGAGIVAGALPGMIGAERGVDPNSYAGRTLGDIGTAGALTAPFSVPAAAVGVAGVGLGDTLAGTDFVRDNVINNIRANIPDWLGGPKGPTDDTVGDLISRVPFVNGIVGGPRDEEAAEEAPPPPTAESLTNVFNTAGLDADSQSVLLNQYNSNLALYRAQYQANPKLFKEQWKEATGDEYEDGMIEQAAYQEIIDTALPQAMQSQSARADLLSNAQAYQAAIGMFMQPMVQEQQQIADMAVNLGLPQFVPFIQNQGNAYEAAMRYAPTVNAMTEYQSQMNQLAQQQFQASIAGNGGGQVDPFASLDAGLMAG